MPLLLLRRRSQLQFPDYLLQFFNMFALGIEFLEDAIVIACLCFGISRIVWRC